MYSRYNFNDENEDGNGEDIFNELINIFVNNSNIRLNGILNGRIRDRDRIYLSEEYHFAKDEFKTLCNNDYARSIDQIPYSILNILLHHYYINNCDSWLNKHDLIQELIKSNCNCMFNICFNSYSDIYLSQFFDYYIFSEVRIPSCSELLHINEYYNIMNRFPNSNELNSYISNILSFNTNPGDYHQQDKVRIPTKNIDKLNVSLHSGNSIGCGICQDDIKENQYKIKLEPCNHFFHHDKNDCLDTESILTWIEKESLCPICKTKIEINDNHT